MKRIIGLVVALALIAAAIPIVANAQVGVLDHIILTPVTANVTTNGSVQFTVVAEDSSNASVSGVAFTWSVDNGGGAIDGFGSFTAGSLTGTFVNTVNVTAFQSSSNVTVSALATVTVTAPVIPVLDHVVLTPVTANVTTGGTQQFTAVAKDAANVTVPGVAISWSVENGGGTIDPAGVFTAGSLTGTFVNTVNVTAVQTGTTNISVSAFATVTVAGPVVPVLDHVIISPLTANVTSGGARQFTAVAQNVDNVTVTDAAFSWSVAGGVGTIGVTGNFTAANTTGTFTNAVTVTATQGAITRSASATVTITAVVVPQVLDHVVISPATANLTAGGSQQFTAIGQDAGNAAINGLEFAWTAVNGGGNITADGLFTAGNATGTFSNTVRVTTTFNNVTKTASATVVVTATQAGRVLDRVVVSPGSASVTKGGAVQFTAVAQGADSTTIPGVEFTWAVVNGGGSITSGGLFTAGNTAGTFTNTVKVTATSGSVTKTAFASVTVTSAPVVKPPLPPGFSKGEKNGWKGLHFPPGWFNGNKTGWRGGDMPPGLSKGETEDREDDHGNQGKGNSSEHSQGKSGKK